MNKLHRFTIIFLLIGLFLGGCVTIKDKTPTPLPTSTPIPTVGVTPIPTVNETPQVPNDNPENKIAYVITAKLDYDAKSMDVQEGIEFTNGTGIELKDLMLAVEPNTITGVFELVTVSLDGKETTDYKLDGQSLLISGLNLPNTNSIAVDIHYKLALPAATQGDPNVVRPTIFGVSDKQVNITDWYPMVVPYSKEGWLLHQPAFYGENLVYPVSDIKIDLTFADENNLPMIASSALQSGPEGTHQFQLKNARDFVFAMGRQMHVTSGESNGITVNSYYFDPYDKAGDAVLQTTLQSIDLYTHLFGPLQDRTAISAVQGDFNDGMEFDGLYYLSNSFYNLYDGKPNQYLILVAAHETCHQWWFGQVANDQSADPWLDESLSTYCEKLYYENFYPDLLDWWWMTRINFYEPKGAIDKDVASYGGFEPYTNAVYRQGAKFLEELRALIGDEAFFTTLKSYAAEKRFKIAAPADFFRILRENTTADISPLLKKYFSKEY